MATARTSTYSLITAENILRRLDVQLTKKEIAAQLGYPDSFYRRVLQLPAEQLYNYILLSQCNSLADYTRYLLYDVQSKFNRAAKLQESGEGNSTPLKSIAENVNHLSDSLAETEKSLIDIDKHTDALDHEIMESLGESIKGWDALTKNCFRQLVDYFKSINIELTDEQKGVLLHRIATLGADIEISEDVLKELKINGEVNAIEKVVIQTLLELKDGE